MIQIMLVSLNLNSTEWNLDTKVWKPFGHKKKKKGRKTICKQKLLCEHIFAPLLNGQRAYKWGDAFNLEFIIMISDAECHVMRKLS